jgi:endonuclease/exonuclease/phosphatase family metal-dependent hydrolase
MADYPIRVVTFNVRCGTANDGTNAWPHRKDFAGAMLAGLSADVIGLQECYDYQGRDVLASLPGYAFVGAGREDGRDKGEMSAVLYRTDRLREVAHGHFWISDTPHLPGSRAWETNCTRMATWVALRPTSTDGDTPASIFHVFNTHLDHRSAPARENGARLIRARIEALGPAMPAILTGDFNARPGDPPYAALVAGGLLRDAWRAAHPSPLPGGEGTFHAFDGTVNRERIDWILTTPHWEVADARIDRSSRAGRYPSDHFAVVADLRLRG